MHGVAPQMCGRVVCPLLGRGAGGRSPGFLYLRSPMGHVPQMLELRAFRLVAPAARARPCPASGGPPVPDKKTWIKIAVSGRSVPAIPRWDRFRHQTALPTMPGSRRLRLRDDLCARRPSAPSTRSPPTRRDPIALAEEIGVTFGGSSAARMMSLVLGTCVLSCTSRSKISSPPGPHE
jgi:hypothetical protein